MKPVFIFDIDGVITQPNTKKPNSAILSFIAHQLQEKEPVALATGRSVAWIKGNIISRLTTRLSSVTRLDYLFISGEKGGVWMEFFDGKSREYTDTTIAVPADIVQKVKEKVALLSGVFFDSGKKTMISVEIQGGEDISKVKEEKAILQQFEQFVKKEILPLSRTICMDTTVISVDIQSTFVSKRIAARQFLEFLGERDLKTETFVIFGDSPNDAQIPQELKKQGKKVRFMYVGETPLTAVFDFPVMTAEKASYDEAVLRFLKTMK